MCLRSEFLSIVVSGKINFSNLEGVVRSFPEVNNQPRAAIGDKYNEGSRDHTLRKFNMTYLSSLLLHFSAFGQVADLPHPYAMVFGSVALLLVQSSYLVSHHV
jgi:hypothetical protein